MENKCTDCDSAEKSCSSQTDFTVKTHEANNIKKVIAIVSGKGGVGKSLVTSLMAINAMRKGKKVGVLDADITGPSIPKVFGIKEKAAGNELGIFPGKSEGGISIISANLFLESEDEPVVWRGPIISNMVKQFWSDVIWSELDYLFVDMPPGTGDVPLTVFQSLPIDGIVLVTSPQDLATLIVKKAYNMAKKMDIPILGIVENMSYYVCPDCSKKENIFGESKNQEVASSFGIDINTQLPLDPRLAKLCDKGELENFEEEYLESFFSSIDNLLNKNGEK